MSDATTNSPELDAERIRLAATEAAVAAGARPEFLDLIVEHLASRLAIRRGADGAPRVLAPGGETARDLLAELKASRTRRETMFTS